MYCKRAFKPFVDPSKRHMLGAGSQGPTNAKLKARVPYVAPLPPDREGRVLCAASASLRKANANGILGRDGEPQVIFDAHAWAAANGKLSLWVVDRACEWND